MCHLAPPSRRPSQILSRFRPGQFEIRRRGALDFEPAPREQWTSPSTHERRTTPPHPTAGALPVGTPGDHPHGARGARPRAPRALRGQIFSLERGADDASAGEGEIRTAMAGSPVLTRAGSVHYSLCAARRRGAAGRGRSAAESGRASGGDVRVPRCGGGTCGLRGAYESGIGDFKSGRRARGHKLPRTTASRAREWRRRGLEAGGRGGHEGGASHGTTESKIGATRCSRTVRRVPRGGTAGTGHFCGGEGGATGSMRGCRAEGEVRAGCAAPTRAVSGGDCESVWCSL